MTKPSNSRRFVNAAWSLLTFQLIASVGAVGVTGVAAFHVSKLVSGAQAMAPAEAAVEDADTAEAEVEDTTTADAAPGAAADSAAPAPAAPAVVNLGPGSLVLTTNQNGQIIARLSDPDGVAGPPRIQWFRNGQPVPGASGDTYQIRYEDSQALVTARADYVDGHNFEESASAEFRVGAIIQ